VDVHTRRGQKYIRLRISGEGRVRLSAPTSTSKRELEAALESKRQWLTKHLERIRTRFAELDPLKEVMIDGQRLRVQYTPARRRTGTAEFYPDEGRVELRGPQLPRHEWMQVLGRQLRKEADRRLPELAAEVSREAGIPFARLFLRNQHTRWGSSSSIGNISLNWRSVMLPPQVQRYLLLHELVHQRHLNHSQAFWRTLEAYCPRYREAEKWLKTNAGLISLFRD